MNADLFNLLALQQTSLNGVIAPFVQLSCVVPLHTNPVPNLTLSLTGVGPFGHTPLKTQNTLKVLKARYCQKLGIPQEVSQACFEITTLLKGAQV